MPYVTVYCDARHSVSVRLSDNIAAWRIGTWGKFMSTVWSAIVLVFAAVITLAWIGVLGFGLMHLIEQMI